MLFYSDYFPFSVLSLSNWMQKPCMNDDIFVFKRAKNVLENNNVTTWNAVNCRLELKTTNQSNKLHICIQHHSILNTETLFSNFAIRHDLRNVSNFYNHISAIHSAKFPYVHIYFPIPRSLILFCVQIFFLFPFCFPFFQFTPKFVLVFC